ncbi:hypothetical protein AVEN_59274-1 [Araneus ventricosus]|uniref:Protein kinase domain-containing protein n=1 Tax=Araneus ventricosus TaxID=182803 RepID=A0A4Y2G5M9_ARAVE|nr:hypothetical protein AVEN_59274-1 [Araneus ventricosus]
MLEYVPLIRASGRNLIYTPKRHKKLCGVLAVSFGGFLYLGKLWTSPELLRMPNPPPEGTPKGDVYAFAIIAHEIVIRKGVFYLAGLQLTPKGKNPHASVNMCWSATLDGLFSCAGVSSGSEL